MLIRTAAALALAAAAAAVAQDAPTPEPDVAYMERAPRGGDPQRARHWIGADVYGPNDARLGEVDDILFDPEWGVAAIDLGRGGVLGLGERHLRIAVSRLRPLVEDGEVVIRTDVTMQEIEAAEARAEGAGDAEEDMIDQTGEVIEDAGEVIEQAGESAAEAGEAGLETLEDTTGINQ